MANFTPLKGRRRPKNFLVLDIESKDGESLTDPGFTRPFMVGIYDGEIYVEFRDSEEMQAKAAAVVADGGEWPERYYQEGGCVDRAMRYLLRKKYRGHQIYAHNAGKFDYLHLMPWLMTMGGEQFGVKFSLIPVASSIQVLDVWRSVGGVTDAKSRRWRFLDSIKLIPTSLDKAGKAFGFEGKLKHDLSLHELDPRWSEYLKQDCVLLFNVLTKFHHYIEEVLQGDVGITAPATAVKTFRRTYLKKAVPRSEDSHEFVRSGYVGGRVEPFTREGSNLYYFDINSSYPAAMLQDMPVGRATQWTGTPPERFLHGRLGFCEVDIEVPSTVNIPPLPVRGTRELGLPEKLLFPTGRLRGIWEWDEIQMAMEYGAVIHKWHQSWWFQGEQFFGDFVRELYQYRDKSNPNYDPGLDAIVKILLNATYGKFGMRTLRRTIYRWDDPDLPNGAEPANKNPDSLVWYADEVVDAPYIMPQVAARVTALARIRLYRAMMLAELLGGTVYYCDTDSVITDVVLPTSNELGALKDEYPQHGGKIHGQFLGPKLYMLEDGQGEVITVKAKGLQNRTRENVELLAKGGTIIVNRLEKVGTLAQLQFSRGPRMISVPRTLRPESGKRVFHDDGTSSPYNVRMW